MSRLFRRAAVSRFKYASLAPIEVLTIHEQRRFPLFSCLDQVIDWQAIDEGSHEIPLRVRMIDDEEAAPSFRLRFDKVVNEDGSEFASPRIRVVAVLTNYSRLFIGAVNYNFRTSFQEGNMSNNFEIIESVIDAEGAVINGCHPKNVQCFVEVLVGRPKPEGTKRRDVKEIIELRQASAARCHWARLELCDMLQSEKRFSRSDFLYTADVITNAGRDYFVTAGKSGVLYGSFSASEEFNVLTEFCAELAADKSIALNRERAEIVTRALSGFEALPRYQCLPLYDEFVVDRAAGAAAAEDDDLPPPYYDAGADGEEARDEEVEGEARLTPATAVARPNFSSRGGGGSRISAV